MDEEEILHFDEDGRRYDITAKNREAFLRKHPRGVRVHHFETDDGRSFDVSDARREEFLSKYPGATESRRVVGEDGALSWRRPDPATPEAPEAQSAQPAETPRRVGRLGADSTLLQDMAAGREARPVAASLAPRTPNAPDVLGMPTFQDITGISPEQASAILQRAQEAPPVMSEGSHAERDPGTIEAWDGRSRGVIGGTAVGGLAQGARDFVRDLDAGALRLGANVAEFVAPLGGDDGNAVARALRRGSEAIEGEKPSLEFASPEFRAGHTAAQTAGTIGEYMGATALGGAPAAAGLMFAEAENEGIERLRAEGVGVHEAALKAAPGAAANAAAWHFVPGAAGRAAARYLGPGGLAEGLSMAAAGTAAGMAQDTAAAVADPRLVSGLSLADRLQDAPAAILTGMAAHGARRVGAAVDAGLQAAQRRAIERRGGTGAGLAGEFRNAGQVGPAAAPRDAGEAPRLEVSDEAARLQGVRDMRARPGEEILPKQTADAADFRPTLADGTPLARSKEEAAARAKAALDALPPAERARRSSVDAFTAERPGAFPLLELLGEKPFLSRPTADTNADAILGLDPKAAASIVDARSAREGGWDVRAQEIGRMLGRDEYLGPGGVEALVRDVLAEREQLRAWREAGARNMATEASDAAEVAEAERLIGEERDRRQAALDARRDEAVREWDAAAEADAEARAGLVAHDEREILRDRERTEERRAEEVARFAAEELSPEEQSRIGNEAIAEAGEGATPEAVQAKIFEKAGALYDERRLDRWFEPGEKAQTVEISKLSTLKDEPRASIDTARERMEKSARGEGEKRRPVQVVENADGSYTVVDGTATTHALREMGERNVRVEVVGHDKGTALRNSGLSLEEVGALDGNGKRITLKTEGIVADPKSEEFREAAYKQAEENEPQLAAVVRKAGLELGLSLDKKAEQVVMRGKNKAGPGVDEREVDKPVKKRKRVNEKTEDDYDGNYDQVVDLIGGSLVLPDGMRYGDAVKAIERNLPEGAKIAKVKKCNIDDELVGYHDMKVSIRFKNGGIGEVIVVEQYLNDIKFHKGGHEIYDRQRFLEGLLRKAKKGKIHLDPDVADRIHDAVEDLKELSNATYARGPAAAEAAASFESMKSKASASLQGLMSEKRVIDLLSAEDAALLKSFDRASQSLVPPSLDEYAMPKRSFIQNDMAKPPSAAAGATTAPAGENLPKTTVPVNPPRAGDAGGGAGAWAGPVKPPVVKPGEVPPPGVYSEPPGGPDHVWLNGQNSTRAGLTDRGRKLIDKVQSMLGKSFFHDWKDGSTEVQTVLGWTQKGNVRVRRVRTEADGTKSETYSTVFASWLEDFGGKDFPEVKAPATGGAEGAAPPAPAGTLFERAPAAPDVAKVDPATETAADPVRQELLDHLRAHPLGSELTVEQQANLNAIAARAEAKGLYRTAAEARQAAGTWTGAPFGADGAWPMEAPPSVANSFGDLVTVVRQLSPGGLYPKIAKRLYRDAAGAFDAKNGQITLTSGLFAAVDPLQRARLRTEAGAEAKKTGRDATEIFREKLAAAMEENLARGPRAAMATFAHEIGHLIDYLPEGTLARGNVFGHLAGLKKHLASTLYPDPATAETYGGSPGLDPKQRAQIRALGEKNVSRYPGETAEEFRRRQSDAADRALRAEIARRGLAGKGEIVSEMQDLAKWFRGEDALDPHFAENPAELFAEAFSAWVNYPKTAAKKAPLFDALFQGWLDKRPDAARAIRAYQDGLTQREAAAAAHAGPGGTPDLTQSAFFAYKAEQDASARWAEQHLGELQALDTIGKWERTRAEAANWLVGPNEIWEKEMFARGGFSNPANLPLFRALQQRDNTGNMAAIWKYRYDTQVKPLLEGVPQKTFLNFLEMSRVAHEVLGPEMEGGRVNLPNPGGVTPGAVGREGNAATSAAAWLQAQQQHHPEIYAKCEAARKALWQEVRNGASMGGEGSPMQLVRESKALSQAQKDALLGNEWYVAFRAVLAPDPTRPVGSDAISTWDGIFSQKDGGTLRSVGDVVANTLVQDYTLAQQLRALDARIEAVDWLRANKPEWIGERVAPAWDSATRRLGVPQLQKPGWRVLPLLRDGKAEGWWVPDFVAESLAPSRRGSVFGERAAASYARWQNASLTSQNVRFNLMNTVRDLDGAAFHAMPRSVRGVGVVQGAVNAFWNAVGDLPLAARMLADNTAQLLQGGKWDPKVVHALASGALNNTAQGGSAYAANGGGGVYGMAADLREQGLTAIPKDELRRFLGGMGFDPKRIEAALGREEGVMKKLGATWDWTAGKLNERLSRGEIRVKAAALADLERRFPDMPPEKRAWYVRNMMGTPDMGNRPLADRNPYFRIVAPFYTPFIHGLRQQLAGVFRKDLGMRATAAERFATRLAIKSLAFVAPALAQSWATDAAEEAERERAAADAARAAGDAAGAASHDAAAAAARERADRNFELALRYESIPTAHKVNGIVLPVGEQLGADSYIYLPSDPSTLLPETLILGMLGASLTPRQFDRRTIASAALGEFTPNFGVGANTAIGLSTGYDVNQGRQIVSDTDAHPELTLAGWFYDNVTGRGRGLFPSSMFRRLIVGKEPFASDSQRNASPFPGFETFARTFLRRSGGGLQERRAWMSTGDKRRDADRKRTDEAFAAAILERNAATTPETQAAAQKRIEDLGAQLAQYGGEPGERVRNLLQRVALRDGQGWTPAQLWALAQRWNISKRDVLRYGDTALRRQLFGDAHADGRGIDLDD